MLTGETLKPYLLHDDRWVRIAVAEYFNESWSLDEDLVPTILDACSRYGFEDNSLPLAHCRRFPLTRTAFGRVLHLLSEDISEKIVMHLGGILAQAPANLLREHENAILSTDALQDDHRRRIRHRLDLMSWSGERLWTEIQDRAGRHSHAESLSNHDSIYDDALIDALVGHDVPDTETICRMLADPAQGNAWLEDYLIELAGARRLTEAIPALVDKLRSDDETFLDSCPLALAKIGHPDIIRRIADVYPKEPWSFRDASASLLGEIKLVESEEAILKLLPAEDDLEVRTLLCFGLCRLFSERGVEVVRRQIHNGYEQWLVSLEEALLPVATVLGIALPEADAWKEERDERERLQAERLRELNEFDGEYTSGKTQGMSPFGDSNPSLGRTKSAYPTVRRHDQKVGRNDPCSCGSGKKHKKCCLGR